MKKNNLSLYIILFASLSIGIFSFNIAFAEVDTDKSVYSKGELINISGDLDLQDDQRVNIVKIEITDSDNDTVANAYVPVNDDDEFSRSYETTTWTAGDYKIIISYNDIEEYAEFEISYSSSSDDDNNLSDTNNKSETSQQSSSTISSDTIPNPPTNLEADVVSSTQIDLSWSTSNGNDVLITGYKIEMRTDTDPNYSIAIANTGSVNTTYSHTSLTPDTVYAYRISAINLEGESNPSSSTTVKTPNNISASNTSIEDTDIPTDVVVEAISSTSVELNWNPPIQTYSQIIQGYTIKQELTSSIYDEIVSTVGSSTNYTLSNLNTDKTYTFVVVANYLRGSSDVSEKATVTLTSFSGNNNTENNDNESDSTQDDNNAGDSNISSLSTTVPSPPVDLQATQISQSRINLSWSAPIDNGASQLLGYKIESKTSDESDYTALVTNTGSSSTTTYSHTGLTAGLTYNYRIYAINSSGESNPSDIVEATIALTNGEQIDAQQQSSLTLQPLQITLSTDKSVYGPDDFIEISGTTNDLIQNIPLGMRVISSDGTIVYVRSISVNNDNTFETVIMPPQRQSSPWQGDDEFTVEVTYNGRIQATTTFENENVDTVIENGSSSPNQPEIESNKQQQSTSSLSTSESNTDIISNNEFETLQNQNTELQSTNQQLRDENNQFKIQIKELNKRIEQLDVVIMEQVRVMMETISASKSNN